ncbi:hypothetical protein D9613_007630 [Agrocybe pediades]|uniref:IucC family-domain-containing protein n=1 Tax=Agrocybe pediades TaxID=84607 RepID=A0A8H4QNF3_9AGAR|nr:hypothetical protein D9613_007630 [Agrocybe pediades]
MTSLPALESRHRAAFAVLSRLISCLVTEQILRAFYLPLHDPPSGITGILVVLSTHTISEDVDVFRPLRSSDIFVVVPMQNHPVLKDEKARKHGWLVGLVDPLDMLSPMLEFGSDNNGVDELDKFSRYILDNLRPPPWDVPSRGALRCVECPVALWRKFVETIFIPENLRDVIAHEIQSSLDWQTISYQNPPACPSLHAHPIEWEQSLVAGHPTHPMHRARMLNTNDTREYDWYHPKIRFVRALKNQLNILGEFSAIANELATTAAKNAGVSLDYSDDHIFVPVHELQISNISTRFKDVEILDEKVFLPAQAQSSIRTVIVPDFPGIALKLAVGVKISSSLRTISHFTADFGPRFSADIVPKLAVNPKILAVETEPSSAVYRTVDPEIAKHFTAVIREEYQPPKGENVIVCAALLESGHANVPAGISAVEHAFGLDTEEKKAVFLNSYIKLACEALIPALVKNGVAFEAHAQNVLLRFDIATKQLRGFIIRDLGGLRIHPATLCKSVGVDFRFLPGHCVATQTLEEIFPKFYHTFIHNHIQRLIRLLGFHHNGRGWEMVREHMSSMIPEEHPAWRVWMSPSSKTVNSKCLMRMRMRDSYRDMVYSPYPNMIQFRPQLPAHMG